MLGLVYLPLSILKLCELIQNLPYLKVAGNFPTINLLFWHFLTPLVPFFMPNWIVLAPFFYSKKWLISITFSSRENLTEIWSNYSPKSVIWPFWSTSYQICPWFCDLVDRLFLSFLDLFDLLLFQNLRFGGSIFSMQTGLPYQKVGEVPPFGNIQSIRVPKREDEKRHLTWALCREALKQNNLSLAICMLSPSVEWCRNPYGWDRRSKPQVFLCHSTWGDNIIQITKQRMFCFYIPLFYERLQS